ncbi:18513_t:CDS:2, partial [Gigaspora margarita]
MVKTHSDWNGISTKLRQLFENFYCTYNNDTKLNQILYSNPSNHDIEEFIAIICKSIKNFIAKSFKIHLEYLIAESKGKDPDYNSIVLNRIKGLNNIMINTTFLAASYLQYANQLELKEEQK